MVVQPALVNTENGSSRCVNVHWQTAARFGLRFRLQKNSGRCHSPLEGPAMNCPSSPGGSRVVGHLSQSVFIAAFVTSFVVRAETYAVVDLGALPPPLDTSSYGRSLSDNGNVAGLSLSRAFLWQGGVMTNLGTLG